MNAHLEAQIGELMEGLGKAAVQAAAVLALASTERKNAALTAAAHAVRIRRDEILAANERDMSAARAAKLSGALLDRLQLDGKRAESIARSIEEVVALPDPIGTLIAGWDRPNGLNIQRVRVPLGVIGIIYESRPNVTADAGALCLKSGNAVILRGGSESRYSSAAIHACLVDGLRAAELPVECIQLVPTTDRAAVGYMLAGMTDYIDVIVPRGGKSLVARVQQEARVPVIGHLEGNCHVYVDRDADVRMARAIVLNAKLRRTGVCGAAETLLIDRACVDTHLAPIVADLLAAGCEIRGDAMVQKVDSRVRAAPRMTGTRSTSTRSLPPVWLTMLMRPLRTSRSMGRLIPSRLLPRTPPPLSASCSGWTARSCSIMRQRSSPTAANSAWEPRSASRPTASMRGGRWGRSS